MNKSRVNALIGLSDTESVIQASQILMHRNIDLKIVNSTHEAMDAMLEMHFNMFLVDARVPMTFERPGIYGGIDFIRFLRMCESPLCEAIVVFVRSGLDTINAIEARAEILTAREVGADCILTNPITLQKFDEDVAPLLEGQGHSCEPSVEKMPNMHKPIH